MTNLLCARCRNIWSKSDWKAPNGGTYLSVNFPTLLCPTCGLENSTSEAIKRANQSTVHESPGFVCVRCHVPRQFGVTVVTETRDVTHPFRARAHTIRVYNPDLRKSERLWRHDPGGFGTQIVREERVCQNCLSIS